MRPWSQRWIGLLLVALLFLQSSLAAAHCLRLAQVATIEICTPEGMRQVALSGTEEPDEHGLTGNATFCLVCHALSTPGAPEPLASAEPVIWFRVPPPAPTAATAIWPPPRGPPLPPRAPPTLT